MAVALTAVATLDWMPCLHLPPCHPHTHSRTHKPTLFTLSTPLTGGQIYDALVAEGYRVTYVRIPLTDGACPLARDFDTFYSAAAAAGPSDALIYTCQVGLGGMRLGGGRERKEDMRVWL